MVLIGAVVFVDTMFYAAIAPLLPALAHQLRLDAETIVARLNRPELGRKVRTLRVRIGRPTPQ